MAVVFRHMPLRCARTGAYFERKWMIVKTPIVAQRKYTVFNE